MFNSLTRVGDTLINTEEVRLCVQGPNSSYHLLLRDGTKLEISPAAAGDIIGLQQASQLVEKARELVETVNNQSHSVAASHPTPEGTYPEGAGRR